MSPNLKSRVNAEVVTKTALSPEDYESMIKAILESSDNITEMEPPTLQ